MTGRSLTAEVAYCMLTFHCLGAVSLSVGIVGKLSGGEIKVIMQIKTRSGLTCSSCWSSGEQQLENCRRRAVWWLWRGCLRSTSPLRVLWGPKTFSKPRYGSIILPFLSMYFDLYTKILSLTLTSSYYDLCLGFNWCQKSEFYWCWHPLV